MTVNHTPALPSFASRPLFISPEGLRDLQMRFSQGVTVEALQAQRGTQLEGASWTTHVRDGVAIIPITGPMFRNRRDAFWSDGTAYEVIARDLAAARDNPEVHSILPFFDTPGGEVNGCAELAGMFYDMRGVKPIIGYVGGNAASAGNWLVAACDEVVVASTAVLGCLGARVSYLDFSAAFEKMGIREIEVVSEQTPRKNLDPSDPEGLAQVQGMVNAFAEVFLGDLARFYGVTRATVDRDFGRGDVFVGQAAVDAGLAHRLGSFEGVLSELIERAAPASPALGNGGVFIFPAESKMAVQSSTHQPGGSAGAAAAAPVVPEGYLLVKADATAAQLEAQFGAALAEARTAGATAERERILGIEAAAADASGHAELVASLKADPAVTPGEAALKILAAERGTKAAALSALRRDESALDNPGDGGGTNADAGVAGANASAQQASGIIALARQAGIMPQKEVRRG